MCTISQASSSGDTSTTLWASLRWFLSAATHELVIDARGLFGGEADAVAVEIEVDVDGRLIGGVGDAEHLGEADRGVEGDRAADVAGEQHDLRAGEQAHEATDPS